MEKKMKRAKIRAAMHRIGAQFPGQPEAKLMLAIINQAANDLLDKTRKDEAERYLRNAVHAEACGVEPAWIRETFEKMGIFPKVSNAELTSPPPVGFDNKPDYSGAPPLERRVSHQTLET